MKIDDSVGSFAAALAGLFGLTGPTVATFADVVRAHELLAQTFASVYAGYEDDALAVREVFEIVDTGEGLALPTNLPVMRAMVESPQGMLSVLWATRWRSLAFPCVELQDPKLAASLACTAAGPDADAAFAMPWDAFLIRLPATALMVPSLAPGQGDESVQEIRVQRMVINGVEQWCIAASSPTCQWWTRGIPRAGMLDDDGLPDDPNDYDGFFSLPLEDEDKRVMQVVRRIVRNVVLWIADPTRRAEARHVPSRKAQRARAHARGGATTPLTRYVLTAPVRIDARKAVRAFLSGDRASPHVRGLVRGHWRNQAHGPGRALRTLRWIEPFWRGGDELPIAVRSHVVSEDS